MLILKSCAASPASAIHRQYNLLEQKSESFFPHCRKFNRETGASLPSVRHARDLKLIKTLVHVARRNEISHRSLQ